MSVGKKLWRERHCSGACADRTFLDRPALGGLNGGEHVLSRDVPSSDVVQVAVVRFANQRVDRLHILVSRQGQHVVDQRICHTWHAQGRCEQDRGLDLAEFIHLGRTRQLAEGVAYEDRARNLFAEQIAGMRPDGGDTRAHVVATDDGRVPDFDAGNIGDRIERIPWEDAHLQRQVRGTWPRIGRRVLCDRICGRQKRTPWL
jgi:hypothetical protein